MFNVLYLYTKRSIRFVRDIISIFFNSRIFNNFINFVNTFITKNPFLPKITFFFHTYLINKIHTFKTMFTFSNITYFFNCVILLLRSLNQIFVINLLKTMWIKWNQFRVLTIKRFIKKIQQRWNESIDFSLYNNNSDYFKWVTFIFFKRVFYVLTILILFHLLNKYIIIYYFLSIIKPAFLISLAVVFVLIIFFLLVFCFNWISFKTLGKTMIVFWLLNGLLSLFDISFSLYSPTIVLTTKGNLYLTENIIKTYFVDSVVTLNIGVVPSYYVFTVSIIALFANYNSFLYMGADQKRERFIIFLNGFACSTILLVFTKYWIIILFSWEMLGMTSYYLINHNDTQIASKKAALKAFTYNRVGDVCLLISFTIYFMLTHSLNISEESLEILNTTESSLIGYFKFFMVHIFIVLLLVGASIKSVQIFSFSWLPESMKAPVPASALIHSATLVAAGFYLISIFRDVIIVYWGVVFFASIGMATAFVGGAVACFQNDIKKTLAYSTIANCGFMWALIALYNEKIFLGYFVLHGLFKSASFMFGGELISLQDHSQDARTYHNAFSKKHIPLSNFVISVMFLCGSPFTYVYVIKHMYSVPTVTGVWYVFDSFLYMYSLLSMVYGLNIIYRIFYFNLNSKDYDDLAPHANRDTYLSFLFYVFIAVLVTQILYFTMVNALIDNPSYNTLLIKIAYHALFGVFLYNILMFLLVVIFAVRWDDPVINNYLDGFYTIGWITWHIWSLKMVVLLGQWFSTWSIV